MVDDPPRFAQNTSARIIGIGSNFSSCASSIVTAARNKITVILSINIARTADMIINVIKTGIVLKCTNFAIVIHSQRKNPAFAIPSTITIIPAMKMIVAQLIPLELSDASPASYQKPGVKMEWIFSVSNAAFISCMHTPNTSTSVARPQPSVTYCLSILSVIMSANITRKMTTAITCATILLNFLSFFCK